MRLKPILRVAAIAAALSSSFTAGAQQKIENLMEQLKNSKDVKLTYSERRDPDTHEIIKSSYMLTSNDMDLFNKFLEAIQAERPNSVNYSVVDGAIYTIQFRSGKNDEKYTYSLIKQGPGKSWMFSTTKKGE